MPAKKSIGAVTAADVDARLPKRFFIMRGEIQRAFGFTREEVAVLIADGTFAAEYPFGRTRVVRRQNREHKVEARMRFIRGQVLEVARRWEAAS